MPRDRRRGRRRHQTGARTGPVSQQPGRPVVPAKQVPIEKTLPFAKASSPVKQPVLGNPRLGKDLRNIAIVAVALVVLLIVLSMVL